MFVSLQFLDDEKAEEAADHANSNVLPFPIANHLGFVDREALKIVSGRSTMERVLERRLAYMYRTQSPPDAAYRDLIVLEEALIARCAELRAGAQ